VVGIGKHIVYPIFRNGSTSLFEAADRIYTNNQIQVCENIQILIRDPKVRFVSGINEYCRQNNLDVKETRSLVERKEIMDRHFCPQFIWLLNLYKFYKGTVTMRPFNDIKKITHIKKDELAWMKKIPVEPIQKLVDVDLRLLELLGSTVELGYIIRKYKNVLS
jgi:hypothetical protein